MDGYDMNNNGIKVAQEYLGINFFEDLKITFTKVNDRHVLNIQRNNELINVEYGEESLKYFALSLIKENINNATYQASFYRSFLDSGYMQDCSRNGVVNVNEAKLMILRLALLGHNRFYLYMEDTYPLSTKKYSFFGYLRDGLNKDELKEIVDYASIFGVDVIPCIQTLSHLFAMLRWKEFAHFRDTFNTLDTESRDVYELIEDMIRTCKSIFKTKYIHIGMDEANDIGTKRFVKLDPPNRHELFLNHLNKVVKIVKQYDLIPLIWSDMFFSLSDGGYYSCKRIKEEVKKLIPKDVELVYWDYYHHDDESLDKMFDAHADTNNKITFAGGVIRWIGFAPEIKGSYINAVKALEYAKKYHVESIFMTGWGDDGDECTMEAYLPIMSICSIMNFYNSNDTEKASSLLQTVINQKYKDFELFSELNIHANKDFYNSYSNKSKYFFYQDPLMGIFDKLAHEEYIEYYDDLANKFATLKLSSKEFSYLFETYEYFARFLSKKVMMGKIMRGAYQKRDILKLKHVSKDIESSIVLLDKFNESYEVMWKKEKKSVGLEVIQGRIGFLKARLEYTYKTLNKFLSREISIIPELELEIKDYNNDPEDGETTFANDWKAIASANMM